MLLESRAMATAGERQVTEAEVRDVLDGVLANSRFAEFEISARGLRTPPAGRKSEATFDHIVATAAEILDDVPLRDITTHLIADRAQVNIATLYRYFADLKAVLVEFAIRYQKLSLLGIKEMAVAGVFTDDRRAWSDEMMDVAVLLRTDTPGAIGIARDGYAIPRVREVNRAAEDTAARVLAVATGCRAPGVMSEDEWHGRYLTMIRSTSRLLDDACADRPADLAQVELLKELAFGFFEPYVP